MKKIFILSAIIFGLFSCSTNKKTKKKQLTENKDLNYVKNSLIINYDPEIGNEELLKQIEKYGAKIDYKYENFNSVAITIPENKKLEDAEKFFKNVKGVSLISKNYIMKLD
ncbi:S8 family serine peptidase [Chishuiella sp.]|uniref:S8 family serine peptidase n=1 Tax=Chishuiella sp. TaxID=1969467 RepID=UPI0028A9478B|nr:hypothetical protein [Chishuiella sp.]